MAYFRELAHACQWLLGHRNEDGGWGMVPGQPSSMVNTAEAIYVLSHGGADLEECRRGLKFIQEKLDLHLTERGRRLRYVAFPLAVIADRFPHECPAFVESCVGWVTAAQNTDDGWGDEANDETSDVFSTYLAIEALSAAKAGGDNVAAACRWISSQHTDSGWPLHDGQTHSIAATSYGVSSLLHGGYSDASAFTSGRELLLGNENWDNEQVVISGTKWQHCRASALVRALIQSGTDPFHSTIAEGIRTFQRRIHPEHGWVEEPTENLPTVRSQYWAVAALSEVYRRFDPAIYIPRMDAERAQALLQEPAFLPFAVHTPFHTIIPSTLFRIGVYLLLVFGFVAASGLLERIPRVPSVAAAGLGVVMVGAAMLLVRKRPKQFPRLHKWVKWILVITGILGILFGFSAYDILIDVPSRLWG